MNSSLRRLLLVTPLALTLATGHAADPGPLAPVLQNAIDKHIVGGAVALVADKDRVLDLEAAGYSSLTTKTPMQTDNTFYIASMTKSFTGAAVMMLVDEGKLTLDDPVEKFLPEFKGQMVAQGKQPPHPPEHPITVREIMDHTSGLLPTHDPVLNHVYSLKEAAIKAASKPLQWEPGTKSDYNGPGINTGARIVEVLLGMPFEDFLQQRIFTPLEMKDSCFFPDEEQAKRLANTVEPTADKKGLQDISHGQDLTPAAREKFSGGVKVPDTIVWNLGQDMLFKYAHRYAEGAHGIISTASDVGRFCQMLLNGGTWAGKRYLSEEAVKQMSSIQCGDLMASPDQGYGVGVFVVKKVNEGPAVGSFGHFGSRQTKMWIDPKNQIVMVLMVQKADMSKEEQKELYTSVFRTMVEKFGRK